MGKTVGIRLYIRDMTHDTRNARIDKHSCMTEYGTCHSGDKTIMETFLIIVKELIKVLMCLSLSGK